MVGHEFRRALSGLFSFVQLVGTLEIPKIALLDSLDADQ
jgi:hypothetical protein